jgi:hypothetical protein
MFWRRETFLAPAVNEMQVDLAHSLVTILIELSQPPSFHKADINFYVGISGLLFVTHTDTTKGSPPLCTL